MSGLHEWFAVDSRYPPLGALIQLAWRSQAHGGLVAWIGRAVWPYPRALVGGLRGPLRGGISGCDTSLLEASIFISASSASDRLWSAEQCVRCRGCVCVVIDATGFDMAATRRLQLAAARASDEPGILALAARPWRERTMLSAATTRWSVRSASPSCAGQSPRWEVELIRLKGGSLEGKCISEAEPSWEWGAG